MLHGLTPPPHTPARQGSVAQSELTMHIRPVTQRGQSVGPPQSTSVSRPFRTPSVQLAPMQTPSVQTPVGQSSGRVHVGRHGVTSIE